MGATSARAALTGTASTGRLACRPRRAAQAATPAVIIQVGAASGLVANLTAMGAVNGIVCKSGRVAREATSAMVMGTVCGLIASPEGHGGGRATRREALTGATSTLVCESSASSYSSSSGYRGSQRTHIYFSNGGGSSMRNRMQVRESIARSYSSRCNGSNKQTYSYSSSGDRSSKRTFSYSSSGDGSSEQTHWWVWENSVGGCFSSGDGSSIAKLSSISRLDIVRCAESVAGDGLR